MQLNILDAIEAERLKEKGIATAENHANSVSLGWSQRAYEYVKEFIHNHRGEFMTEDIRVYFAMNDLELPPHNRAFGGLIVRARNEGLVKSVGLGKVSNPKAHRCFASRWIKV